MKHVSLGSSQHSKIVTKPKTTRLFPALKHRTVNPKPAGTKPKTECQELLSSTRSAGQHPVRDYFGEALTR